MDDVVLQNAERAKDDLAAKINSHQAQIEQWRKEIGRLDEFISLFHRLAGDPLDEDVSGAESGNSPAEPKRKAMGNSPKEMVMEASRAFISAERKPVPRTELLASLRSHGLVIEGADPESVLNTMLWRTRTAPGVVFLKGHGYWLAEEPYSPAAFPGASLLELASAHDTPPPEA